MIDFPKSYPNRLRKVSWCYAGKYGIYPYFNRHVPYDTKGSSLFVKQVLLDYFTKERIQSQCKDEICQHVADSFSVVFNESEKKFEIKAKKDKFDQEHWRDLLIDGDPKKMLRDLLGELKRFYGMFV